MVPVKPVRERLVGDHSVHERDCRHEREIRQSGRLEPHLPELWVERWIEDSLSGKDYKPSRIESRLREKGAHGVLLVQAEGCRAGSVLLPLLSDVRYDLLNNPLDLSRAERWCHYGEPPLGWWAMIPERARCS